MRRRDRHRAMIAIAFAFGCSDNTATSVSTSDADGTTSSSTTADTSSSQDTSTTTSSAESEGPGTDDPTDPSGDPSTCEAELPCAGIVLDNSINPSTGWATGGDGTPLSIFLSSPGTSCGDDNPSACTNCGNYEWVSIGLQAAAQTPGSYTEADGVDVSCSSIVTDCNGNGGGDAGLVMTYTIEIVSIDESCIVGEIESDGCGAGQFAVIRCP